MGSGRTTRATRALRQGLLTAVVVGSASLAVGQTIEVVATFHNIGIEVHFGEPVPEGTQIGTAIRESGTEEDYRPGHPLSPIGPARFAGSIVGVDAGTAYDIKLTSPALTDGQSLLEVSTRRDAFPDPTGRRLFVSSSDGHEANDGLSAERPLASLDEALRRVRPGDTILLAGGRYLEGDLMLSASGTPDNPIVIRAAPGETAILDGTDPDFEPAWEAVDAGAGLYRTRCGKHPTNAYLDGEQLFHYRQVSDLRDCRWGQVSGYAVDGNWFYIRFPGGSGPKGHRVTIPRYTTGLTIVRQSHIQVVGLEFCYYGYGTFHRGIHLDAADYVLVDRCRFHHTGLGVTLKRDADFNVVQNCSFTESPVNTWSWHAVKSGGIGYEAGGVGIYGSDRANKGNVIRHNHFHDMFDGSAIYSGSLDGPTTNLDFHGNLIESCSDDGIETDGAGINNRIYHNTLRRFLTGISVAPCAPGPTYIFRNLLLDWRPVGEFGGYPFKFNVRSKLPIRWVFFYHNTCVTSVPGQPGFLFKNYSDWKHIISRNNIYVGTTTALESWSTTNPVDFDYDLLHTTQPDHPIRWARTPYDSLTSFADATGQEVHGVLAAPGLKGPGAGDLGLQSESPAVDRAVLIPGFNEDYTGEAPDIGAFEFPTGTHPVPVGPLRQ